MPNPDYTDYTDNRVRYIVSEDNVNVICPTALSTYMQLQYCIPAFPRLYQYTTFTRNTDHTDCTDYRVSYIILEGNVNVIFPMA